MKILWVEDFGGGLEQRLSLTREWLEKILCSATKERLTELEASTADAVSFLVTLAGNEHPIVWADGLVSGLVAMTLGTGAYKGNKYSKIPSINASYEVALLDLDIPYGRDSGQLGEFYSDEALAIIEAEDRNGTFALGTDLKTFPGVIIALRLLQLGMPADRIFFLTANSDVSSMPTSIRSIMGPEFLEKQIIAKNKIGDLLKRVEKNAYYQLKMLIRRVSEEVGSIIEQGMFIKEIQNEFKSEEYKEFLFIKKENTINFLKEFLRILPEYASKNERITYYNIIIDKILREFHSVTTHYELLRKDDLYIRSIQLKFYIISLRYLRNINSHTSYLKNVTECEVAIIFLMFIGFISELYCNEHNELYDFSNIISISNVFFDNESILGKLDKTHKNNNNFINDVGYKYMSIVNKDGIFLNITKDCPGDLDLSAWDMLRMTFWSQVSFSDTKANRYSFDWKTEQLRKQNFFDMLGDRLALDEK